MKQDELYKIFEQQLHCNEQLTETAQDLIRKVATQYTLTLLRFGTIPFHFLETVIEDIEAEVVEMYRKKTYGFVSLHDYRQSLKSLRNKKTRQNKSEK